MILTPLYLVQGVKKKEKNMGYGESKEKEGANGQSIELKGQFPFVSQVFCLCFTYQCSFVSLCAC